MIHTYVFRVDHFIFLISCLTLLSKFYNFLYSVLFKEFLNIFFSHTMHPDYSLASLQYSQCLLTPSPPLTPEKRRSPRDTN